MTALLVLLAGSAVAATAATVHAVRTDGYSRIPTRRY